MLMEVGLEPPPLDDRYRLLLRQAAATVQQAHAYDAEREDGV
jgi:hypothetical protein